MSRNNRVGISSSLVSLKTREEVRVSCDTSWGLLCSQAGLAPVSLLATVENVSQYLSDLKLKGVILGGGNDIVGYGASAEPARDSFESSLISFCLENEIPIVGICRGCQFLSVHFGGELEAVDGHVKKPHRVNLIEDSFLGKRGTTFITNSFHNWALSKHNLGQGLRSIALAEDGSIEAVAHIEYQILGVMWHPERPLGEPAREAIFSFLSQNCR